MMSEKVVLEIRVDRMNEKGVFVAEQILNILHNTVDEKQTGFLKKKQAHFVDFSFEIAHVNGVLRFFLVVDKQYRNLLENQFYAQYPNVEITEISDYLPESIPYVGSLKLSKEYFHPIKIYTAFKEKTEKENIDPFSSITSALSKAPKKDVIVFRVNFSPIIESEWKDEKTIEILSSKSSKYIKKIKLSPYYIFLKIAAFPVILLAKFFALVIKGGGEHEETHDEKEKKNDEFEQKFSGFGYGSSIEVGVYSVDKAGSEVAIREVATALNIYSNPGQNALKLDAITLDESKGFTERKNKRNIILNTAELAGLVHLPTIYVKTPGINWVVTKTLEPPHNLPLIADHKDVTPIGVTNFRGSKIEFGIHLNDRRRHVYVLGKTGMGKSTLLENMIYDDILKGRWVALVDPHGDLAETILSNIPKSRTNDVILFDPADQKFPIAFNMLENVPKELQPIVASGLVSIFKKMFADSWGPRLEHILRNTILTLLQVPDSTIMSIPLILTQKSFRLKILSKLKDPILEKFWTSEFEVMDPKQMTEAVSPILNKVGQFLSSSLLRNVLGQNKNPFSLRWIMDNQKIIIVNLSKGRIGEDSSALLGSMMITKFQIDAMSRADIEEDKRKDFFLYVDEFQNFATDSFATILSEARKYRLSLVMANQYIAQMTENVQGAVFGNVGTLVSFQVGYHDATVLSSLMNEEIVTTNDLVNLRKYDIYTKLLVDGMPTPVFSATTFGPIKSRIAIPEQKRDVILKVSREKYAKPVEFVEKKIYDFNTKVITDEKKFKAEQEAYKEKMKEEKKKKADEAKKVEKPEA